MKNKKNDLMRNHFFIFIFFILRLRGKYLEQINIH